MYRLIFLFFLIVPMCNATTDIEQFLIEANKLAQEESKIIKNRTLVEYLPQLELLAQKYAKSPIAYNIENQNLATAYSFAGLHLKVLEVSDRATKKQYTPIDDLNNFVIKDAVSEIQKAANDYQIVMVNEAHHIAQHRVLTYRLLEVLWQQGFRYFAAEAFNPNLKAALKKDYIVKGVGHYIYEPTFTNLVKKAKALGFTLISYDSDRPNKSGKNDERERNSATVLKEKIFNKDPKAKVIVHVGYAHIDEKKWLASKLKTELKVDILTIDQTKFIEKSNVSFENPLYTFAANKVDFNKPFVFLDQDKLWSSEPERWDITVFWPRTQYLNGRPDWAILDRKPFRIYTTECKKQFPCMVEVFKFDEKDELATDRIIILSEQDHVQVFLNTGTNIVTITGPEGKRISKRFIQG